MAWTPPSDAVETQASSGTAGWTPPSDAVKLEAAPAAVWTPPADAVEVQPVKPVDGFPTPAPVKPVNAFAPTTPVKAATAPVKPVDGFAPGEEFKKGVVGAATVGIPSSVEQFKLAGGADVLQNTIQQMQLLDKIDKGEITSPRDLPRDPQLRMYYASNPEVRGRLRQSITNDLTKNQAFVNASLGLLEQYKQEGQKFKGRQEKVLESESAADFGNWLAKNVGAGAVYAVPSIIAAVVGKQPGLFAFSTGMGYTEAVGNRLEAMAKELQQLPPEQRAARVAQRVQEADDVNLAVAIASGALDAVLGPAASVAKQGIKGSIQGMGRKEVAKQAIKEIPKQGAQEFVAGGGQEAAQIAGKVKLGERDKFATAETARDVFEGGASELAGSLGTSAGLGAFRVATTPSAAKPVEEKAKVEPTFDAGKDLEKAPVQPAPVATKEEAAPAEVTPAVQPAATPEFNALVEKYKKRGYMPEDAATLARNEIEEANAPIKEGAEDVAEPISEAGGESTALSTQPTDDVSATTGAGELERDGVVSAGPDVSEPAEGKGTEPTAVNEDWKSLGQVQRYEEPGVGRATTDKPHGIYTTPANVESPHKGLGGERSTWDINKDANVLDVTPLAGPDVAMRKSAVGAGAGVAAVKKLLGAEHFGVLKGMDKGTLITAANAYFPSVDFSKYYDAQEVMEAFGAQLAKQAGYDAIWQSDKDPAFSEFVALTDNAMTPTETKGADVGTETTETKQTTQEGQEAPAAGAVTGKPRGRPKAAITEEQRAEKEKARTESRAEYMKGERALPKLQAQLDEAAAPIDETKIDDDEGLKNAENEKRALKRDTINAMMDLEAKHRGTALGKRIKTALADRSKISQKDYDDVAAGRKYKSQERVNKSSASVDEVEDADEGFKKATNAAQAINQIIKTGTGFQKFLAKRLRGLVNGVKFVVVEETDPLPEQLSRHQEAWGNDNSRARGVYFENTATGEKVIYVRGASAGSFQGINNTTVLHELLHAATQQKLEMALLAVQRGFSGDAKLVRAYNDLIAVMNNAKDEYNRLANLGQLPTDIYYLKTVSGVFSNPHEFVSYGMTDPYFQKFLMGAYGFEEETGLFNRFVDAIRELLGLGIDSVNALSDLIVVTDKILNAKLTPTMQMIAKADKANAVREGRGEKVSAAKAKAKANSKKITAAERKILRSKEAQEVVDGIDTLVTLRDPNILLDLLKGGLEALNVQKLKYLLPALQTNIIVEWGESLGIKHMDKTWRAMQDMSAMRMKMLGGASDVVNKWLNVQPGMYGKLIKGKKNELNELSAVMHYATDKSIDPAISKKDPVLNKMWDGLSDTAKEIYVDVRDYYKSNFDLYRLLLNNRIDAMKIPGEAADPDTPKGKLMAEIKKMYETAKGLSPYFPLMRYGNYWLRVGSGKKKEFYMFESVIDREMFLAKRVRDLQKEGDTRSLSEMKADEDIETGNDLKGLRDKSTANDTAPLLKQIFELIGEGISETDAETLKDQIYQLYLTTMPEQSFRRQFIHRKGTAGFSGDALRNFITSSTNMANQLARLKYGPQMIREVDAAKESLKGNPDKDKLEMLVNELGERVQLDVYPPAVDSTAQAAANFANKSAFLYFMTSVKTAVVQFSSLPIFGAPVLVSRHNPATVAAEMGKMMLLFNDVGVMDKEGKFTLPTLANSRRVKMNEEEQRAFEAMTDRGVSEITMAYDLMDRRRTPSTKYSAAWKTSTNMMGALFHHVERLNREVMFMTSFRLSRKPGPNQLSFDDAIDQAVKDTYDALGNFSEQNRARYMRGPVGRTLLQFKTFPAFVTTYLARNGYRAMAGMDADAKKEAATQLFGTLFMSGLLAGYVGIPGISAAMGAIQGVINAMRDEEDDDPLEERDLEFWFRSVFIPNFFGEARIGGVKIGEIVEAGLIDTITGLNMSGSLSMNNMWFPELKEQRTYQDTMQEYALSLMGPFASLTLNQIPSGIDLLMQGKTMQGLERLLPAFLRQPLTAVRYSKEGATTTTGAVIKEPEEFTKAQLIAQAAGARTTGLASVQEANFKANALKAKVILEKGKIVNRVDLEASQGSDEDFDAALEKLITFNARNPQVAVKGEQLSKILKARMEKRLNADRGFDVDKKFYPYLEELLATSREKIEREAAK
jgi:hypothetical protein